VAHGNTAWYDPSLEGEMGNSQPKPTGHLMSYGMGTQIMWRWAAASRLECLRYNRVFPEREGKRALHGNLVISFNHLAALKRNCSVGEPAEGSLKSKGPRGPSKTPVARRCPPLREVLNGEPFVKTLVASAAPLQPHGGRVSLPAAPFENSLCKLVFKTSESAVE
jgi:hypothetical protein